MESEKSNVQTETQLKSKASDIIVQAKGITITSQDKYEIAGNFLLKIDSMIKEAKTYFEPICKKAKEAHTEACNQRDRLLDPLKEAKEIVSKEMAHFYDEQKRKREEEEAARLEASRKEAEALNRKANKLEEKGQVEKATQLRQEAGSKILQTESPKATIPSKEGTRVTETIKAKVVDKKALIKAIAKGDVSDEFMDPNQGALNKFGQSTKGKMPIPGVVFYTETNVASTGRVDATSTVKLGYDSEQKDETVKSGIKEIVDF